MSLKPEDAFETLVRKIGRRVLLRAVEQEALRSLSFDIRSVPSGSRFVEEGEASQDCCLLVSGYACRFKVAQNRKKQIVSFHVPGDILNLESIFFLFADHSAQAISRACVASFPARELAAIAQDCPAIGEALWQDTLVEASIFREWVLNVGRRDAKSRIAHMLCEFAVLREAAGLGDPLQFTLPMTQQQIGEATGLTAVHVNRTLQSLNEDGVMVRNGRRLTIADWNRMVEIAAFDPRYLRLDAAQLSLIDGATMAN